MPHVSVRHHQLLLIEFVLLLPIRVLLVRLQVTMQDLVDEMQRGHVMEVTDEPMRVVVLRMLRVHPHILPVVVHMERVGVHVHVVHQRVPEQSGVLAHIQRILTSVERLDMWA